MDCDGGVRLMPNSHVRAPGGALPLSCGPSQWWYQFIVCECFCYGGGHGSQRVLVLPQPSRRPSVPRIPGTRHLDFANNIAPQVIQIVADRANNGDLT